MTGFGNGQRGQFIGLLPQPSKPVKPPKMSSDRFEASRFSQISPLARFVRFGQHRDSEAASHTRSLSAIVHAILRPSSSYVSPGLLLLSVPCSCCQVGRRAHSFRTSRPEAVRAFVRGSRPAAPDSR
jgi:hypothetical protein